MLRSVHAIQTSAAAGDDETVAEPQRSKLEQIAFGLRGAAYQVAIGALSGAGGHMLSG
jgi:hypothetical protein